MARLGALALAAAVAATSAQTWYAAVNSATVPGAASLVTLDDGGNVDTTVGQLG
jgi:hypothetical protein